MKLICAGEGVFDSRSRPKRSRAVALAYHLLLVALALPVAPIDVDAQSGAARVRKRPRAAATSKPKFVFSRDVDSLPPNYQGHEVRYFIGVWARAYRSRGEFESTAEYLAELGSKVPDKTLAFSISEDSSPGSIRYDADAESLVVSVPSTNSFYGAYSTIDESRHNVPFSGRGIRLWTELVKQRTVTARTILGRRFRVRQELYYEYGIAYAADLLNRGSSVHVTMDRETAKRSKPHLRVLLVCHIDRDQLPDAVVFTESNRSEASLDSPYDVQTVKGWLAVVLDELWVYNVTTGEILLQAPVSAGQDVVAVPSRADSDPVRPPITAPERDQVLARARELAVAGKDAEALVEIASVLGKHPDLAPAYTLRALVLENLGRLSEAVEASQTAIALDPSVITPYLVDARLAVKQKDCAAAKRSIDAATGIDAASPELEPLRELVDAACASGKAPD